MAQIKPEEIVDDLSSEFRRALEDTIREVFPDQQDFDSSMLFSAFKRAVARKCNTWERVKDAHVRAN